MIDRRTRLSIDRRTGLSIDRLGDRLAAAKASLSPDAWAIVAIVGAVLLANALYLLGIVDGSLVWYRSGLTGHVPAGLLPGQTSLDPSDGFVTQALGHRAALDLLHLHWPWWNPYEGTGTPLFAEMQSAALFPLTLLNVFANGLMFEQVLLELIAGVSTYLLLRRLAVSRPASTAAGVAFALCGFVAWFSHTTVNAVPFLPLLLLGIELAYGATVAGRRGGWWLIAVSGALSVYAGFIEVAYIDTLLAVFWFAWRCCCLPRERLPAFAAKAAAAGLVGTLLAAPVLVASINYVDHGYLAFNGSNVFGSEHLLPDALPQLLLPYVYGPLFAFTDYKLTLLNIWATVGGYLSTSLVLFGLLGVFSKGRRGLRLALLLWIGLALSRIYGLPGFGEVLGLLPRMSQVQFFRYAPASVELAVVILAALGLDRIASLRRRRPVLWVGLASLALVALAAIGARSLVDQLGPSFNRHPYYLVAVAWGAGIVLLAVAAASIANARTRLRLCALLLVCDALVLFMVPEASAPRKVPVDSAPVAFLQRHLGSARFFTLGPLAPNYGSYFGLASLDINDVPVPDPWAGYVQPHLDQTAIPTHLGVNAKGWPAAGPLPPAELLKNLAGYREAGVAYVLTPPGQALPQSASTFKLVFRSPSTWIYHLAGAAPYFTPSDARCSVKFVNRETAQLSCPAQTTLVRRETDFPGWSAQVAGRPVPVRSWDGDFQAVSVPAGSHRVQFGYAPPGIKWGLLAFVAGCVWLLAAAVAGRRVRPAQ